MSDTALELVLRRDRTVIVSALVSLLALAWAYVLWIAADMDMGGMDMSEFRMIPAGIGVMAPALTPWSPFEFFLVFIMWAVMMIGMMTPSVTPMILIHARVARQAVAQHKPFAATAWFAGGYLAVDLPHPALGQDFTPSPTANRTCGFPASGSPTGFTARHTEKITNRKRHLRGVEPDVRISRIRLSDWLQGVKSCPRAGCGRSTSPGSMKQLVQ
jgi:hypothetical protein